MRTFRFSMLSSACAFVLLATVQVAQAQSTIPLPNRSTRDCSTRDAATNQLNCFRIINTSTAGFAVGIEAQVPSSETGYGVLARAPNGIGVRGFSTHQNGVGGTSEFGAGVVGQSQSREGVLGESISWFGVTGTSAQSNGVFGKSQSAGASGVYGENFFGGIGIAGRVDNAGIAVYGDNPNQAGWSGFFTGRVFARNGVSTGSDARLKKNVTDTAHGLTSVMKLRPVSYELKAAGAEGKRQLGFIAQELQHIVPEVVSAEPKNGMLSVEYSALLPVVVKAIQEQQKLIERHERRIAALEAGGRTQASLLPSGASGLLALSLAPIGLVAAFCRRRRG